MIFSFSIDVRNRGRSSHKSSKRTFYLHHLPSLNFDFKVIDVNSIKFNDIICTYLIFEGIHFSRAAFKNRHTNPFINFVPKTFIYMLYTNIV